MVYVKTIVNNNIRFLNDAKGNPYYILIEVDDFYNPNMYKIIMKHWIE